jgi:hypothetical protein
MQIQLVFVAPDPDCNVELYAWNLQSFFVYKWYMQSLKWWRLKCMSAGYNFGKEEFVWCRTWNCRAYSCWCRFEYFEELHAGLNFWGMQIVIWKCMLAGLNICLFMKRNWMHSICRLVWWRMKFWSSCLRTKIWIWMKTQFNKNVFSVLNELKEKWKWNIDTCKHRDTCLLSFNIYKHLSLWIKLMFN